jgi:DNA-binding PadR family transcriptional regulator
VSDEWIEQALDENIARGMVEATVSEEEGEKIYRMTEEGSAYVEQMLDDAVAAHGPLAADFLAAQFSLKPEMFQELIDRRQK